MAKYLTIVLKIEDEDDPIIDLVNQDVAHPVDLGDCVADFDIDQTKITDEEPVITQVGIFDELQKRSNWLGCLEAAGVDNWEGYGYAQDLLDE